MNYIERVFVDLFKGMVGDRKNYIDNKLKEMSRNLTSEELQEINSKTLKATIDFIEQQDDLNNCSFAQYVEEKYIFFRPPG